MRKEYIELQVEILVVSEDVVTLSNGDEYENDIVNATLKSADKS